MIIGRFQITTSNLARGNGNRLLDQKLRQKGKTHNKTQTALKRSLAKPLVAI